ncbi:flagellar filament capping protein FliD [Vibrio sp. PNB22_3_1]
MQIDAAGMASQLATYDVQPFQNLINNKLQISRAESAAIREITSALSDLGSLLDDYSGLNATLSKVKTSLSSEQYLSVKSDSSVDNVNLNIYVEQLATSHQLGFSMGATSIDDVFATSGTFSVNVGGEVTEIDLSLADMDADGSVSYKEFEVAYNAAMSGKSSVNLVRSNGSVGLVFSAEDTGVDGAFTIASTTGTALDDAVAQSSLNPYVQGANAKIWIGGKDTGMALTNSSNTFEGLVGGMTVTVNQINEPGQSGTVVKTESDVEASTESIQEIVGKVNEIFSTISRLSSSGSEDQSRGILASNFAVRSIDTQISSLIRSSFDGVRLFDVGIEIDRDGQLNLDTSTFEGALTDFDIDAVLLGDNGLFSGLGSVVDQYTGRVDGLLTTQTTNLKAQQDRYESELDALSLKYEMSYQRYLAQFSALNNLTASMESVTGLFV